MMVIIKTTTTAMRNMNTMMIIVTFDTMMTTLDFVVLSAINLMYISIIFNSIIN